MLKDTLIHFFSRQKTTSKEIAKERLKLVLVHDRADMEPEVMENLRKDLMAVIEKYMEVQVEALDIQLKKTREGNKVVSALMANIPIKNIR